MRRLRPILFRVCLLMAAILFALGVMEVALRWRESRATQALVADSSKAIVIPSPIPGLYYTLKPGVTTDHLAINSLGLNMPEYPARKESGHWRIVVVGDSYTMGIGANKSPDAFPNRTDRLLRQQLNRDDIEVWNCGVGGYNVDQVFLFLSNVATNYQPNAVIYGFCFNDYWGPNYYLSGQAAQPAGVDAIEGARIGLLDRLKQIRVITFAKGIYEKIYYGTHGYEPAYVDRKIEYPSWAAMKQRIVTMRDYCRERGWPFAVLIMPLPQFVFVDDSRNLALHDLRAHLEKNGILFADATPLMREHRAEGLINDVEHHPSSKGYEVIAATLSGWLLTNRATFLPPSK